MGLNHLEQAHTDSANTTIRALGGKLGGLHHLYANVPELRPHLVDTVIVPPGSEWDGIFPAGVGERSGKVIVRGSDRRDFAGLVDVIDTKVVPRNAWAVERAIQEIREQACSAATLARARRENITYDGRQVTVGLQPFIPHARGSVLDHPNQTDRYVVSWVGEDGIGRRIASGLYNPDGDLIHKLTAHTPPSSARQLVGLHRMIREKGNLVCDDLSFQMEFVARDAGGVDHIINQVRAFLPIEHAKQTVFGSKEFDRKNLQPGLVFGVTPKEGVTLPLVNGNGFHGVEDGDPYAWLKTSNCRRMPSTMPRGMKVFLVGQESGSATDLEHDNLGPAMEADVTIFELPAAYGFDRLEGKQAVNIICDGENAIVESA